MTLIDTSGDYGEGRSEELIKRVIAGQRDRAFVCPSSYVISFHLGQHGFDDRAYQTSTSIANADPATRFRDKMVTLGPAGPMIPALGYRGDQGMHWTETHLKPGLFMARLPQQYTPLVYGIISGGGHDGRRNRDRNSPID